MEADTSRPASSSIAAVAALDDELRRGMYWFVRRAERPVTRDEAAASVGISRKLAAFHLDKLVQVGLLTARYDRLDGPRRVGRAPKIYQPSDLDVRVSIPQRRHDTLSQILLEAILHEAPGETARQSALRAADRRGEQLGADDRTTHRPGRLGAHRALTLATETLTRYGFEPHRTADTCVRLRNCPFHPMADQAPDLVCGINHAFLTGYLRGLGATTLHAALAPRPHECCVQLAAATPDP